MKYKLNPALNNTSDFLGINHDFMEEMFGKDFMSATFALDISGEPKVKGASEWAWNSNAFLPAEERSKMGKILYPIGTKVQLRDSFLNDPSRNTGNYLPGERRVVNYIKGSKTPYVLSNKISGVAVEKHFAKEDIKSYRQVSSAVKNDRQDTATKAPENSLSASDVRQIIREEFKVQEEAQAAKAFQESLSALENEKLNKAIASIDAKEDTNMSEAKTIRQKIRYATKSKQERILEEEGILQNGALTEQGRRVVIDFLWDGNKELQTDVYKAVVKATGRDKKSKKAEDDEA